MNRHLQEPLRRFTRVVRPLAMRSAGTSRSGTAVLRHVGRRSGRRYETPVTAYAHDDEFLIALPYGERTDWLRNVLAGGGATLILHGEEYPVDEPEVRPTADVADALPAGQVRVLRLFGVGSVLRLHRA